MIGSLARTLPWLLLWSVLFAAAVGHCREDKASQYYEDALKRFEMQDTAGAVVQLKNALQQDPNLIAAHILLGRAYLRTGDPESAESSLGKALQLGVSRSEIAVPFAQALYEQGKYQDLLERLPPEAATGVAQKLELLVLRGHAHKGLGDHRSAAAAYEQARALDPRYVPAILSQAELAAQKDTRAEADRLLDQALALAPRDPKVWSLKAAIAHAAGDIPPALAAYEKSLALDPQHIDARIGRAALLVDLNRLAEAEVDLDYLRREAPKEPRALYLRAIVHDKRGQSAEARDALLELTRALDPAPVQTLRQRAPQLLLLAGLSHYGLNQMEKARVYLAEYITANPRHPGSRKVLGSILVSEGNHRDAISVLEPARRAAPYDPDVLALLAAAYMGRHQYHTASNLLEDALRLSRQAPEVHATLGFSLLRMGQQDLGLAHLESAFAKDPARSRVGIALTVLHIRRGDTKRALEIAEIAAKGQPNSPIVHNLLGVTRVAAGDRNGARSAYRRAVEIDATFLPAQLNLGRLELADGQYAAVRGRLQRLLKATPNSVQVMFELALTEEAAGNTAEALRWLEKLHAMDRRNVAATSRLVDLLVVTGRAQKALEMAKETVAVMPENLEALASLGRACLALGDAKQAQVAFERMTRLATFDVGWQYRIAQYQLRANNPEGAAYSLDKILTTQSNYLPAQVLMTEVDLQRGTYDKAEQRARTILSDHPSQSAGHRLLGDIALARGNHGEAVAAYRVALDRQRDSDGALRLYRAMFASGQDGAALEFMEAWLRRNPRDAIATQALAEGYLRVGNLPGARSRYEALLEVRTEDPHILNNLANVLARQGDQKALDYAQRAYRVAPQDASIQDTLGWLLVRQGEVDAGLRHLREARLRDPQNPEIRYHLAAALAKIGRKEEAQQELGEALRTKVAFDDIEAARSLWQSLTGP